MRKLLLFVALLLVVAVVAQAQTVVVPRLSLQRVSASLGGDVEFSPTTLDVAQRQFMAVGAIAYKLGPNLSAVTSSRVGLIGTPLPSTTGDRQFRFTVGLRYTIYRDGKWTF